MNDAELQHRLRQAAQRAKAQQIAHAQLEAMASHACEFAANAITIGCAEAMSVKSTDAAGANCDALVIVLSGAIPPELVTTLETLVIEHRTRLQAATAQCVPFPPAGKPANPEVN